MSMYPQSTYGCNWSMYLVYMRGNVLMSRNGVEVMGKISAQPHSLLLNSSTFIYSTTIRNKEQ